MVKPEQQIEDRIINNLAQLGYAGAPWIRRAKICRGGFGTVDLLILPTNGKHRLVLTEVKQENNGDAAGKVGQLLLYYVGALGFGRDGLLLMQQFAQSPRAHDPTPKSLQMLSGGYRKGDDWKALQAGDKIDPTEVGLIVGLAREPHESLLRLRDWLKRHSSVDIRIVVAPADGRIEER
jgi:hypothetical protein